MFDIGFSELMVIGVVALLVIGPERLPRVARTAGALMGRFQRYVATVKSDIQREIDQADLGKLKTEVQDAARAFEQDVNQSVTTAQTEMQAIEQSVQNEMTGPIASPFDAPAPEPGSPAPGLVAEPPELLAEPAAPAPTEQLDLALSGGAHLPSATTPQR